MKLIEDHKEKQSIVKGKICLLCDRKFILHKSLFKTVATLDAQKLALQTVDNQHESMKQAFDRVSENNAYQVEDYKRRCQDEDS